MSDKIEQLIKEIAQEEKSISQERRLELEEIAKLINQHLEEEHSLDIIVVCTHNSRRSQLGEVWINTLAHHFNIKSITAFSGGMEDTAFNYRMVDALINCGFNIEEVEGGSNPKYVMKDANVDSHQMFSKVYDHDMNPQSGFMAFMVCGHADENCPIVHGMKYRIPLRYKDPKEFDDTGQEREAYLSKVKEIGKEIYYIFNRIELLR